MKRIASFAVNILRGLAQALRNGVKAIVNRSKPRWKKLVFLAVQVIAILLVILGWYIDHSEQSEWVTEIFAPDYGSALVLYEKMFEEGIGLVADQDTPGFAEIAEILSEYLLRQLPDLNGREIVRLKVVGLTSMVISEDPSRSGPRVTLSITLDDGQALPPIEMTGNLEPEIRERFLDEPLFSWGERFQWIGIVITFVALIIEKALEIM